MSTSLSERIKSYEDSVNFNLLNKLPIFIKLNLRSFSRVCKKIEKPYSQDMADLMSKTLYNTILDIDNSVFGFYYFDTFNIVIKNDNKDDSTWLSNNLQKMNSVAASLATYNFYKILNNLYSHLDIINPAIFDCTIFPLPNIEEAMNALIDSQGQCIVNAINLISYDLLSKKYGKNEAVSILEKKNTSDRILLLKEDFDFDIKLNCPPEFLYGINVYKAPHIHNSNGIDIKKNKWIIDKNTSKFNEDKGAILNILHSGYDVFRIGRDIS